MIFLVSDVKGKFESFGVSHYLEPITYPKVDVSNILVVENSLGKRILGKCPHILRAEFQAEKIPGFPLPLPLLDQIPDGSKIIVIRGGGIGDLILLIPALRIFKNLLGKQIVLSLATFQDKIDIFRGIPEIDELKVMPARLSEMLGYDFYVEFSARLDLFREIHMTDYYLSLFGISYEDVEVSLKEPWVCPETGNSEKVRDWFHNLRKKWANVVYVNLDATDIIRRLPPSLIPELAKAFPNVGFVISRLENKDYLKAYPNLFALDTYTSLKAYFSLILNSDAIVSSDSSAYHIAGAFRKPAVALFGPIASALRAKYYSSVIPIDAQYVGKTCTSPCGLNAVTELKYSNLGKAYDFSKGCPEAQLRGTVYSPCLLSISSEKIIEALSRLLSTS